MPVEIILPYLCQCCVKEPVNSTGLVAFFTVLGRLLLKPQIREGMPTEARKRADWIMSINSMPTIQY